MFSGGLFQALGSGMGLTRDGDGLRAGEVPPNVLKQGSLKKRGRLRRNWLARHFVLTPKSIRYYKEYPKNLKGTVPLTRRSAVLYVPDQVRVCRARQLRMTHAAALVVCPVPSTLCCALLCCAKRAAKFRRCALCPLVPARVSWVLCHTLTRSGGLLTTATACPLASLYGHHRRLAQRSRSRC